MILLALLLAAQGVTIYDDPGDAPPVPDAVQDTYGAYLGCLMDPLDPVLEGNGPSDPAEGAAKVRKALADCHVQRLATVAEMEARFPRTGLFASPAKRSARIEEIVGKAEQRLAFMTIEPDKFRAIVTDLTRCWNAGGGDTCKPSTALK